MLLLPVPLLGLPGSCAVKKGPCRLQKHYSNNQAKTCSNLQPCGRSTAAVFQASRHGVNKGLYSTNAIHNCVVNESMQAEEPHSWSGFAKLQRTHDCSPVTLFCLHTHDASCSCAHQLFDTFEVVELEAVPKCIALHQQGRSCQPAILHMKTADAQSKVINAVNSVLSSFLMYIQEREKAEGAGVA